MAIDLRVKQVGVLFSAGVEAAEPPSLRQRQAQRAVRFRETVGSRVRRHAAGLSRLLRGDGVLALPRMLFAAIPQVSGLPDPEAALASPAGFCGFAGPVAPERLLEAAARGLRPGGGLGPVAWWSPPVTHAMHPANFETPKRVRGHLRRRSPQIGFDRDLDLVLVRCREEGGRWLSPALMSAYASLADMGYVHSFEVRDESGTLRAGGFGVALGRVFAVQSTFGDVRHLADLATTILARHLSAWGYSLLSMPGAADPDLGFVALPRAAYLDSLLTEAGGARNVRWQVDHRLCGPGLPGTTTGPATPAPAALAA